MLLCYIDESGINYQRNGQTFGDGPFIIWSGLMVPEGKYFHLERLFYDLAKKKLEIKNWENTELHATDIWLRRGDFAHLTEKRVSEYFEELAQLLGKLDIKIVIGIKKKSTGLRSKASKDKENGKAIYSLLHGLERVLGTQKDTAVVIADESSSEANLSLLEQLYYERTSWRYNPGAKKNFTIKSRFYFESLSCFLLDQVHHTKSERSLFVQLTDNMTYVIRKVFQHSFYHHNSSLGIVADISKVPISTSTFRWLSQNIQYNYFSEAKNDVIMGMLEQVCTGDNAYLHAAVVNGIE